MEEEGAGHNKIAIMQGLWVSIKTTNIYWTYLEYNIFKKMHLNFNIRVFHLPHNFRIILVKRIGGSKKWQIEKRERLY